MCITLPTSTVMADVLHNSVHFLERRLSEVEGPIIGVVRERPELVDSEMQNVEARADRVVWKRSEPHKITSLLEGEVRGRRVDHCATQVRPSGNTTEFSMWLRATSFSHLGHTPHRSFAS